MIKAIKNKVVGKIMLRQKTSGGLIIPDAVKDPQAYCKVTSVGEDVTSIKEGDVIVVHIRGGMDVLFDKCIMKVLNEEEIYGTLTDENMLSNLEEIVIGGDTEGEPIIQPAPKSRIIT